MVAEKGRDLLARFKPRETDTPAEDTTRNSLEISQTRSGRTRAGRRPRRAHRRQIPTALSPLAKPAPAADGTPDERTPAQRNGDGLDTMLDLFLGAGQAPSEGGVKPHLVLTTKLRDLVARETEVPDPNRFGECAPFRLEWGGGISQELALMLACDCTITSIVLDEHEVPLKLGRTQRLVPASLRRAVVARDVGVCAAVPPPPGPRSTMCAHWSQGGPTDLDNLGLLCGGVIANCTAAIGNSSWVRTGTRGSCHRNGSTNTENPCRDTSGAPTTRRQHDHCTHATAPPQPQTPAAPSRCSTVGARPGRGTGGGGARCAWWAPCGAAARARPRSNR